MKKAVISMAFVLITFVSARHAAYAASIEILSPANEEVQIAPTRDFYVVGTIKREANEKNEPLNVLVELLDSDGNTVRSLQSNVDSNAVTPDYCTYSDYEDGFAENSQKGVNLLSFTPPDIIYNGFEFGTFRDMGTKIVVKEKYFAAALYGGATKDYDLQYSSILDDRPIGDIDEGVYTLKVTALNADGEEVCSEEKEINVGKNVPRVIYNSYFASNEDVKKFAEERGYSIADSVVGYWYPYKYISSAPKDFSYYISRRYINNLKAEYSSAEEVDMLLYAVDTTSKKFNMELGSALSGESELKYFYYDIGEPKVEFEFMGAKSEREGVLKEANGNVFIDVLRASAKRGKSTYVDFELDNGVVMTSGSETTFSGVYSPVELKASQLTDESYSFSEKADKIKIAIRDENNNSIYEAESKTSVTRRNDSGESFTSRFEFEFSILPEEEMVSDKLFLTVSLCDKNGDEICKQEIPCSIKGEGSFIEGYNDSYWGKTYCDEINLFGASPEGEAIDPDEEIKRGDFAAMVNRFFGFAELGKATFSDIDEDSDFYNDVLIAQNTGYMSGDEHSRVKADEPISREEAIIVLARLCGAEKGDFEIDFEDSDEISFWAKDEVETMCSTGIISGFEGYLHPKNYINASEAVALICKTLKWMYNAEEVEDEVVTIPSVDADVDLSFDSTELSELEIGDVTRVENVDREEMETFVTNNLIVLDSLKNYVVSIFDDGIYVRRVGEGLEVRDYRRGAYLTLSPDALRILTDITSKYNSFTLRYNPGSENAVYFTFGKDDSQKEFGIAFSETGESKTRELEQFFGDWYYYTQK